MGYPVKLLGLLRDYCEGYVIDYMVWFPVLFPHVKLLTRYSIPIASQSTLLLGYRLPDWP